jgi:hypothetical protein
MYHCCSTEQTQYLIGQCWGSTRTYPDPDKFNSNPRLISWRSILILSSYHGIGLLINKLFQISPPKFCTYFSSPQRVLQVSPASILLVTTMSIDDEPQLYAVSSSHPLHRPSYARLSSPWPYSRTISAYVSPQIYINYLIYNAVCKLGWVS